MQGRERVSWVEERVGWELDRWIESGRGKQKRNAIVSKSLVVVPNQIRRWKRNAMLMQIQTHKSTSQIESEDRGFVLTYPHLRTVKIKLLWLESENNTSGTSVIWKQECILLDCVFHHSIATKVIAQHVQAEESHSLLQNLIKSITDILFFYERQWIECLDWQRCNFHYFSWAFIHNLFPTQVNSYFFTVIIYWISFFKEMNKAFRI